MPEKGPIKFNVEDIRRIGAGVGIVFAIVMGIGGMSGFRFDKFGRTDFDKEMLKLRAEFVQQLKQCREEKSVEIKKGDIELREDLIKYISIREHQHHLEIPPEPTRVRIKAIERCLEINCNDFEAPTQRWYDPR